MEIRTRAWERDLGLAESGIVLKFVFVENGEIKSLKIQIQNMYMYLSHVIGRNAAHVVMHCGNNRDRVSCDIHTGKDHGSLGDPG